jgi:hypothetical protein
VTVFLSADLQDISARLSSARPAATPTDKILHVIGSRATTLALAQTRLQRGCDREDQRHDKRKEDTLAEALIPTATRWSRAVLLSADRRLLPDVAHHQDLGPEAQQPMHQK